MKSLLVALATIALFPTLSLAQADDTEALKSQIEELLALGAQAEEDPEAQAELLVKVKGLVLSDSEAWFTTVFGPEMGPPLAAEYDAQVSEIDQFAGLFVQTAAQNRTEVSVTKLSEASDPEATGLQQTALAAMTSPVPLYSVRMTEPGQELGMHLWSFAKTDNGFKLVGKMRALNE